MSSAERILQYTSEVPSEAVRRIPGVAESSWPENGALSIRNVSLRYRPGLPLVLCNISVEIEAGWRVGVVGRTGSGKSTLILAMLRLVEP